MKKMTSRGDEVYSSDVFEVLFEYEVSRCKRYPSPLALLQIEMTPSTLNEEALVSSSSVFATALNAHLRSVDIPSSTKNIFTVLLPTSNEHGAYVVCERLISVFKNSFNSPNGAPIAFSIQIGATAHAGGSEIDGEIMLKNVEEALKQSRLKGPNTCVFLV